MDHTTHDSAQDRIDSDVEGEAGDGLAFEVFGADCVAFGGGKIRSMAARIAAGGAPGVWIRLL